ncbi:MAG: TlyA family RNA methyltransferase [Desulfovibrionaceae bacterium]|jgi:23S rRNA (cytidine1920-2'-O)/16S rRNA (cytidine1409-2'-O)-methyltransferase|nr:TlyA family RNA methyltransferase [Desulfovibrionaceae bacterium]
MPKIRADQLLADQGLAASREQAKRLIMAGEVLMAVGGGHEPVLKPGQQLRPETELVLRRAERFVSRGAYKLLTALEEWDIDVRGLTVLDAGASTGGFTDCLLQHGAARVYAVDVGTNQLHEKLRADARVVSMENVNLRHAGPDLLPTPVDGVVADVSFISLTLVLPPCVRLLRDGGFVVALIKPQFEVGPHQTVKGVVRDEGARQGAVDKVLAFARDELGLAVLGVVPSRLKGPKGNQEYVAYLRKTEAGPKEPE